MKKIMKKSISKIPTRGLVRISHTPKLWERVFFTQFSSTYQVCYLKNNSSIQT